MGDRWQIVVRFHADDQQLNGHVVQWIERETSNFLVEGSNPSVATNKPLSDGGLKTKRA